MKTYVTFPAKKIISTIFFVMLIAMILTNAHKSTYYALQGLNLWFNRMIPSLLPFMILSALMVRLQLTEGFVAFIHPILRPILNVRKNVTYAIIMGFICGFPMGARVTSDLLRRNQITQKEGAYLLSFCNNIGPVYFTGFVLPLLKRRLIWPYLFGMYAIPLLYGLFLRYSIFRNIPTDQPEIMQNNKSRNFSILEEIDEAITTSLQGILSLGGYMIFFNLLNLIPSCFTELLLKMPISHFLSVKNTHLLTQLPSLFAPILEITGGLSMFGDRFPIYSLILLPFGGLCCLAQTYSIIRNSGISIHSYIYHKLILACLTCVYYLGWFLFFPKTFLQ